MIALYADLAVGALVFFIFVWPRRTRNPFAAASAVPAGGTPLRPAPPAGSGTADGASSAVVADAVIGTGGLDAPHEPTPGALLYAEHSGNTDWINRCA